jgi:hypothetical protein
MIELNLDLAENKKHPSFTAKLEYNIANDKCTPLVVSLLFSEKRSMYTYKNLAPVRGNIIFGNRNITLDPKNTIGLFRDCKGYYPYRMKSIWASGFSNFIIEDNAKKIGSFGFSIAENQVRENNKDNENALWVDGALTPLPSCKITRGNDNESDAVIQDLEGMVDLTFKIKENVSAAFNLFLTRSVYDTPIGLYNGMLIDKDGKKIPVRNVWGTIEKLYLRV